MYTVEILLIVILVSVLVSAKSISDLERWNNFKRQYEKQYQFQKEEQRRFTIFQQNLRKIEEHNEKYKNKEVSYELGITKFADVNEDELNFGLNRYVQRENRYDIPQTKVKYSIFKPPENIEIPDQVDWRQAGAVTEVRDQQVWRCSSCYAFCAVGALEGQLFIKEGKLISLSEQNILDCCTGKDYKIYGCDGGMVNDVYKCIEDEGISSRYSYPYNATERECKYNKSKHVSLEIETVVQIEEGNEEHLKAAVATVGPITADIHSIGFSLYKSGVWNNTSCLKDYVNHCVLIVGYGTTSDGIDYWLVKNSEGKLWGEDGYIRMIRNFDNQCNIATEASYPVLLKK